MLSLCLQGCINKGNSGLQRWHEHDRFIQSVSTRRNSRDNAPMESFFGRMKCHIIDLIALCPDFEAVESIIDGYIDTYNNRAYQYELGGLTPAEFYTYSTTDIYSLDNYYGVIYRLCHLKIN